MLHETLGLSDVSFRLRNYFWLLISFKSKIVCISEKTVVVPSRFVSLAYNKPLFVRCRCGKCHECRKLKRIEWSIRSQYEFKRCLDSGGYVMFDCLTYDEDHVPWLHDHDHVAHLTDYDRYAFNRDHLRHFFVRFRRNLGKKGYDIADNLRYFVASEYGDRFTKRPHYHLLLFVNFDIHPLQLSQMIQDAWPYGHTDGLPFKSRNYVLDHNVIRSAYNSVKVSNYVSKYVNKPYLATQDLVDHVRGVFDWIYADNPAWMSVDSARDKYDRVLRQTLPFHLESKGFGDYAMQLYDDLHVALSIPLVTDQIKRVSLPSYYFRKLFYDVSWFNGVRRWVPNDRYYLMQLRNVGINLDKDENDLIALFKQLELVNPDWYNSAQRLLAGRSLRDFAKYRRYYRYRSMDPSLPGISDLLERSSCKESYNPDHWKAFGLPMLYGYHSRTDRRRFHDSFFSDTYLVRDLPLRQTYRRVDDNLLMLMCYNQETHPDFRNFDDLDEYLNDFQLYYDQLSEREYQRTEQLRERFDTIYSRARYYTS